MKNDILRLLLTLMVVLTSQIVCYSLPIFRPKLGLKFRAASMGLPRLRQRNIGLFRVLNQPTNTRNIRLCSRNQNVFLQVHPNGAVNGTHDANSRHANLVQESLSVSIVRFKAYASNRYIAMDKKGRIYSTFTPNAECLFKTQQEENYYHTFWSLVHGQDSNNWMLSVKKNGKMRRGSRTRVGEKSTQFVVLPANSNL